MNAPVAQPATQSMRDHAHAMWSKRPGLLRGRNLWIVGGALLVLLALWFMFKGDGNANPYRTAPVDRGAISRSVSATGTLQPVVSANVGSTVSGPVQRVEVDYNTPVRVGQVLARIDPTSFQQRVTQLQASLAQAQAQYATANADYQRYVALSNAGFASAQLMQQQRAARDTASAAVAGARANLASAQTDLSRTVIRSPINGVVVDKQVSVGQSVAASFQAATLFTIAQDLSHLQANISVDEADIGDVRQGQEVQFTVDAFPDRDFRGVVSQVRQQGVSDQGVVSYTVVVTADNPDQTLLPGMTANADIVIERQNDVLRVPTTALRFRPSDPDVAARGQALLRGNGQRGGAAGAQSGGQRGNWSGGGQGDGRGGQRMVQQMAQQLQLTPAQQATVQQAVQSAMQNAPPPSADGTTDRRGMMRELRQAALAALQPSLTAQQRQLLAQIQQGGDPRREVRNQAVVWVLRGNLPTPVVVWTGIADNTNTLLYSGLNENDQVIIGGGPPAQTQQRNASPFGGPRGPGGGRGFRAG
ncbi:MAG: efflux RND transporter periplasmic adaptor subunit [Proteobacteria bacterium]|nr:efflux RND transporter periplasmic adaptor subunit [Pseudomonadota bacterium]